MIKLKLESKTDSGRQALIKMKNQIDKTNFIAKASFRKMGYACKQVQNEPFALEFSINNPVMESSSNLTMCRNHITNSLMQYAAQIDIDYIIKQVDDNE
jgi:hypothetical protein